MKKFFQKSLLLILLLFGGIHSAFADYWDADSFTGYFNVLTTDLSLDKPYITWRFPVCDYDGTDDVLLHDRWYVGGDAAGYNTYVSDRQKTYFDPPTQGKEILYCSRAEYPTSRSNGTYGVAVPYNTVLRSDDIETSDMKFYPGVDMGPAKMKNGFFVRWTGWWDIDDDGGDGYWLGMSRSNNIGSSNYGADWTRKEGQGVVIYKKATYNIPDTKAATEFKRAPGAKIQATVALDASIISANHHNNWECYYGFSTNKDTDENGYFTKNRGNTVRLYDQESTYTLTGTFDETENITIYYHQYYLCNRYISNGLWVEQHFQSNSVKSVTVKGYQYPKDLNVNINKWNNSAELTWTRYNTSGDTGGKFLVFRQKSGSDKVEKLATLSNTTSKYTDASLVSGASYTYWVTFAPTAYGTVSAPIDSKLTCKSSVVTHTPAIQNFNLNAGCSDDIDGGIRLDWKIEDTGAPQLKYYVERLNETSNSWETLNGTALDVTYYVDKTVDALKTYKYRIRTSYWSKTHYSATKEIRYDKITEIKQLDASKGDFTNMVKVKWNVKLVGSEKTRFIVSRKTLGSDRSAYKDVFEVEGTETSYTYDDMSAVPGEYYSYKVTAYGYQAATATEEALWFEGNHMEVDGFVQARGVLAGRIKYGTGTAVSDVKVVLIKSEDNENTAKQFYSYSFSGDNTAGMQWKLSDEVIKTYFTGSNRPWSVQLYVRPDEGITDTQSIFDVNGYAGLGISPTTGGYELQVKSATGSNAASYGATGIVIPADEYSHLVFSYDGESSYTVRAIRLADQSEKGITFEEGKTLKTFTGKANVKFEDTNRSRTVTLGKSGFKGYIDEVRIWSKNLTNEEIIGNHDRTLMGTESDLLCYWPMDEGIDGLRQLYDYSKSSGTLNSNHAMKSGAIAISTIVPTEKQLSLYGVTDQNGNYVIRGVPFNGEGTTYMLRPEKGIHEFNPTYHTRFVSSNAITHNDITFEDVSSFPVTGVVYYENTTYPVQGCNLYVDGNICSKDGKLIETDEQGRFEISVPIGDHHITVGKNGHTFTDEGRYPTGVDTKFTFDHSVSNLTFYDNTLVNIAGRIVGGNIEGDKPVGFAESVNNIGVAQIVLTPTNDSYLLNAVKVVNGTTYSYESNPEVLTCASGGDLICSSSWRGSGENAGKIFIQTDANTGEFSVMVPPITYNVSEAVVVKTTQSVGEAGFVDLSNATQTTSDTLMVAGEESVFEYHTLYKRIYHSEPNFTVTQDDFENGAFGIAQRTFKDEVGEFTIDFVNTENDPIYNYDYPFFVENDNYVFTIKGYEQYTNYDGDTAETTTVPLKNCIVNIANGLANNQRIAVEVDENNDDGLKVGDVIDVRRNQITLNEKGEAKYRWQAGNANITAPYTRTLSITYEIDGKVNTWYYDGDQPQMEAIILGTLPTGTNFVTQGPDQVLMVLRDPPGSGSSAEWSSGTVSVYEKVDTHTQSNEGSLNVTTSLGGDVTLVTGVGVAFEQQTSTSDDFNVQSTLNTEITNSTTKSHTLSINEAISTSDDPSLVGTLGDVYIGQSTNLFFGKAREVGFHRTNGEINLGVKDVMTVGSKFNTQFNYTHYYIESYLLPNLEAMRNNLLIPVTPEEYNSFQNTTDGLKFITMLSPEDPNFGTNNSDKVWGDRAVKDDVLEGPSYKIVLPQRLIDEKVYDKWETVRAEHDSIFFYNLQINNWIKHLAANEKEKVEVRTKGKLLKNYSFDGGAGISYSYEKDTTTVVSRENVIGNVMLVGNVVGFDFCGLGWEIETTLQEDIVDGWSNDTTISNIASLSFNLVESGDDALSVDVYESPMSYIFYTRGGQTSAPYEDVEYTQYFEPGKHKLHEATMQIEVPDIEVEVATVTNLPSGSAASYTLLLTNKSEIDCDLYYKLLMMDETNPDGAQLSIDGVALSDNRVIKVPAGEVVKKTLLLKQSNLGILDYKNIGIVLSSIEQGDPTGTYPQIADTVYISAYYVPSSSPVKMELNRTLLNSSSGANLDITFNSFDRNYYNLKAFRIQYMKQGDTDWTTLKEYLVDVEEGQQLSSMQTVLPEAANVTYSLDMNSFADGKYTFRVLSASTYGTGESTLVTEAIEVIKDMSRPMAFGTPKPTTGFLGMGDDIEITFNENINNGRLTTTGNFIVTAALNGQTVAHDVALKATGSEGAVAKTEANINLIGKSFAVDMWARISGEGTIFSHGNGQTKLTLGVKEVEGNYYFCVNGEVCDTEHALPADKWIYLAFSLDQEGEDSRFSALYANDATTVRLADEFPIERYEGNGVVALGNGFTGAIHEVTLWDEAIDVTNLQAQMYETKMPTTEHLIGYWKFSEGMGTQAKDLARNRHMNLDATSWYLNNKNMSLALANDALYAGVDGVVINLAECAARNGDDFAVEMWFCAEREQDHALAYLFHTDAFSVVLENKKLSLRADDKVLMSLGNKAYNDDKWHHLAINVLRNGNTSVYIDGEAVGQIASANVPALQTAYMSLGGQRVEVVTEKEDKNEVHYEMHNKLKVQFDEIRVWNATLNANVLRDRMHTRLKGDEPGLAAYYPFEEEKLDGNMQVVTEGSAMDMVTRRHKATGLRDNNYAIVCTDEAPALKPVPGETNVNYNFVASERGIVIELGEDANRMEGVTVNITVKDVLDLNGNKSLPITWTALVQRNQLSWFDNTLDVVGRIGEEKKFTATVTNQSAQTEYWALNDLPSWLSANFTSGALPALGTQEITFTVDASAPTGKSEFTVYMSGNNAILVPLTVNMNLRSEAPDWSVEPADYETNATLFGAVKINVDDKVMFSEDEDDLVAAFIDGKCAGVTNVQYEDFSDSYRIYLNIYGNSDAISKEIELKVWDASTGVVHPIVMAYENLASDVENEQATVLHFEENATWGDFDNTYLVYATNYIQQSTPLKKNWNWISVHVNNVESQNAINYVLESINPNGNLIKNKSAHSLYIDQVGIWNEGNGAVSNVTTSSMYKLQMNAADTLVVNGELANGVEVRLAKGWNWIPYTRNFTLSLDDALASAEPMKNDQIKGQEGFAMYNGTAWSGTLKSVVPGRGYLYSSRSADEKTLTYPEKRNVEMIAKAPARRMTSVSMFAPIDPCEFESNMTVLAVCDEEDFIGNVQELAVFDGARCMAVAKPDADGFFFLTIPGDKTVTGRLSIVAVVDGNVVEASTSLFFSEDATYGDFDRPFKVALRNATTAIDEILASGDYNRMKIVDLSGRTFYSGTVSDFNENDLKDDLYIFEFFTADGQIVCYKKYIRRNK